MNIKPGLNKGKINMSMWNLLVLESISYVDSKQISQKEKYEELQSIGFNIGERISNSLMSSGNKIRLEEQEIIKFISSEVFSFIYKPVSKTLSNNKKTYIYEVEEYPILLPFICNKEVSQENAQIIDFILNFFSGIIKGSLKALDIESIVNCTYKYEILYQNITKSQKSEVNPISFTVNILQTIS